MILRQGEVAVVHFDVTLQGNRSNIGAASFVVYRNGIVTSIVPAVDNSVQGHYVVSYTIPANWEGYDVSHVRMDLQYSPSQLISHTKQSAVIDGVIDVAESIGIGVDFANDLLTADQVYDSTTNQVVYYRAGTNQSVELHRQDVNGSTCVSEDVSLIEPAP